MSAAVFPPEQTGKAGQAMKVLEKVIGGLDSFVSGCSLAAVVLMMLAAGRPGFWPITEGSWEFWISGKFTGRL